VLAELRWLKAEELATLRAQRVTEPVTNGRPRRARRSGGPGQRDS
jgi:hypothetical protein